MIECGVPLRKVRRKYPAFAKITDCLISHEHGDHANYLPKLWDETDIKIHCGPQTVDRYAIPIAKILKHKKPVILENGFSILPLKLEHDQDVETFGFLITHSMSKDNLLYASDTRRINYNVKGLTIAMIEANYSMDLIAISERYKPVILRTIKTHMEIGAAIDFVYRHKESLKNVYLIHMSKAHSDPEKFIRDIERATGVPTFIAWRK